MIGALITAVALLFMVASLIRLEIRAIQSRRELQRQIEIVQRRTTARRTTSGAIPITPMPHSHSGAVG